METSIEKKTPEMKKTPEVKFGCMSWAGVALTIAIVVVRAFQPGAQPIETWSAWSWFLMMLPIALPIAVWAALAFLCISGYVLCTAFEK